MVQSSGRCRRLLRLYRKLLWAVICKEGLDDVILIFFFYKASFLNTHHPQEFQRISREKLGTHESQGIRQKSQTEPYIHENQNYHFYQCHKNCENQNDWSK